jgi:hypothetical protein
MASTHKGAAATGIGRQIETVEYNRQKAATGVSAHIHAQAEHLVVNTHDYAANDESVLECGH